MVEWILEELINKYLYLILLRLGGRKNYEVRIKVIVFILNLVFFDLF